jgi:uncharacterized protein YjbI with pentapeptide repeats
MANDQQLERLRAAISQNEITIWNRWREENPHLQVDLSGTDLSGADFRVVHSFKTIGSADFHGVDLSGADLSKANLFMGNLRGANLVGANFIGAYCARADFQGANLNRANLNGTQFLSANLREADLRDALVRRADLTDVDISGAKLSGADLSRAILVDTNLEKADLTGCRIYGISAWDLKLDGALQDRLVITPSTKSNEITVSDLEVAQFIYLLVFSPKIRKVIDTVTSKVVLILGRFTQERKAVLDAIREALQQRDLVPVIFDFDKPTSRDLTETVRTLAHMARFIVADITDPKSIPQELTAIIPNLPSVPVQPLILNSECEYAMYEHWKQYPWVLPIFRYKSTQHLLSSLDRKIITPAENRHRRHARM